MSEDDFGKKDIGNGSKTKVLMDSGEVMVGNEC